MAEEQKLSWGGMGKNRGVVEVLGHWGRGLEKEGGAGRPWGRGCGRGGREPHVGLGVEFTLTRRALAGFLFGTSALPDLRSGPLESGVPGSSGSATPGALGG